MRALLLLVVFACAAVSAAPNAEQGRPLVRSFLEGLDAGDVPVVAGQQLMQPDMLARLYRSRENQPFWLRGGALDRQVDDMLAAIGDSVAHGFSAERYHRSAIERLRKAEEPQSALALELLLTDAFLAQALHRGSGAVSPPNLDADWQLPSAEVNPAALLGEAASRKQSVRRVLDGLWPTDPEYARLLERRAQIAAGGDETTIRIAAGPLIKPGQSGDRIVMLKQRLLGPGEYDPLYDDRLKAEVMAFQRSAGLEPDGIVGDNTLEFLNATRVSWIDRIDANLERWRWLPRSTPDTYIRVNIAAFTLRVMDRGKPSLSMNVIVGRPYRRTPVFTETVKYMVFNPYWNVPYTIATKDKLPDLKKNAAAVAGKGFEAKANGSDTFVSVDAIDWSGVTARNFNYLLRQRPGSENALGLVKFMLPNPNAVYLHDTPSRELFARQERSFSSGCIRLEKPMELARWLLSREGNAEADSIPAIVAAGETRTIYLKKPVPTYLVYFTAFSLDDGNVTFRRDIYERDQVIIDALRAQQT